MSSNTLGLASAVEAYLNAQSNEHPVLAELRELTASMPNSMMQIAPSQGAFLAWLLRTLGVKRAIEVGVFTGYSSLVAGLALPSDGHLLACDVNEEWTKIARRHWKKAGVESKIELVLGPATETLATRLSSGEAQSYDFAFIDADKENYETYYELCLRLVRPGGILVIDNVLWSGSVADRTDQRATTNAIRRLNRLVKEDHRVESSLIPVADGLLLARKL